MPNFFREHSWPVAVSLSLHGLLVALLVLMTYLSRQQHMPTLQPLPIDAVVVDSQVLHAAQRAQVERAEQEVAQAKAAAEARAAAEEARAAAAKEAANQAANEAANEAANHAATEAAKQSQADQEARARAADARKAVEAKLAADARQAAEIKQAADSRRAELRQAVEARQVAEARHAADAQAAEDKKAAAAKQAADTKRAAEAELRRQLADEEHRSAVESGPLRDRYISLLRNKIQNAWIKPSSATPGTDCIVEVTQVPGGEVTAARVTQCNGDAAVRQSIENAVYRASPLPDPPDPALFERNLSLRFRPND